jgi:hypothetical protein
MDRCVVPNGAAQRGVFDQAWKEIKERHKIWVTHAAQRGGFFLLVMAAGLMRCPAPME